jgi:hypothetical protein
MTPKSLLRLNKVLWVGKFFHKVKSGTKTKQKNENDEPLDAVYFFDRCGQNETDHFFLHSFNQ